MLSSTAEETLKQRNGNLLSIPLQPHCHCLWWMPAKSSYLWDESDYEQRRSKYDDEREGTSSSSPLTLLSSNPLDCASHSVNGSRCCTMIGLGLWHALRSPGSSHRWLRNLVDYTIRGGCRRDSLLIHECSWLEVHWMFPPLHRALSARFTTRIV